MLMHCGELKQTARGDTGSISYIYKIWEGNCEMIYVARGHHNVLAQHKKRAIVLKTGFHFFPLYTICRIARNVAAATGGLKIATADSPWEPGEPLGCITP
jgi:hypothetical protein